MFLTRFLSALLILPSSSLLFAQSDTILSLDQDSPLPLIQWQQNAESEVQLDQWDIEEENQFSTRLKQIKSLSGFDIFLANRVDRFLLRNGLPQSPVEMQALHFLEPIEQEKLFRQLVKAAPRFREQRDYPTRIWGKVWLRYGRRIRPIEEGINKSIHEYPGSAFVGDANQWLTRIQLKSNKGFHLGLCGEKDIGEAWNSSGFDHWSGYLAYSGKNKLEKLVLGNYNMQAAQGLTIWTGLRMQFPAQIADPAFYGRGLAEYAGALENGSMKGIAFRWRDGPFRIESFYSRERLSGSVDEYGIRSISMSGLHRTPNELSRKDNINLQQYGTYIRYSRRNQRIGIIVNQRRLFPNQLNSINHRIRSFHSGIEYLIIRGETKTFSEITINNLGGWGVTTGTHIPISSSLQFGGKLTLLHPKLYGPTSSLQDQSRREGLQEILLNLHGNLSSNLNAIISMRQSQNFSGREIHGRERNQNEITSRFNWTSNSHLKLGFTWQNRWQDRKQSIESNETLLSKTVQLHRYRLDAKWSSYANYTFKSRIEFSRFEMSNRATWGRLAYQEISKKLSKNGSLNVRLTVFSIEDYENRIYGILPDISYSMNLPMYSDYGHEWNIKFSQKIKAWTIEFRSSYRAIVHSNEPKIDFRAQVIYRL